MIFVIAQASRVHYAILLLPAFVITALLAQGLSTEAAAAVGVEVHARAGDRAAAGGERGLLASDLLAELRGVINP